MKFCPTCQTRYDEEILRFCTKDGTPLIDEKLPNFTELPSESVADEDDEETIVRRKSAAVPPYSPDDKPASSPRIVIPTSEDKLPPPLPQQQVRTNPTVYQTPQKSNTGKVVLLTILGTVILLAGAGGIFWMLQSENAGNANSNANSNIYNVNTNPPTNLNIGNSFNFNVGNVNTNTNTNVNLKTPSPTPKPTPTPTPKPTPSPDESNSNNSTNTNSSLPGNTRSSPSPTPTETPAVNRPVNAGVLNGRAVNLPTPAYPAAAKAMRAGGRVTVQITVDESGNVLSAKAMSGHPLLRQSAEAAARQSRINPIKVNNQAVSATGLLVYNFIN